MLIGFTGEAGAGKDTACKFVLDWAQSLKFRARRDAFADRLKVSAARALGFNGSTQECIDFCNLLKGPGATVTWFYPTTTDATGGRGGTVTGREYLQLYGTEAHREVFDTNFWVNVVLDQYEPTEILVITDARFANEAEAIRAAGGTVTEIVVPNGDKIAESSHASEAGLPRDLIDYTIVNDGTLDQLRDKVLSHTEHLMSSYTASSYQVTRF